jgi:peroxiredoxin Q/BCP
VGDRAPDFSLPTGEGTTLSLKDLKGKKVVLYFYPKDDTPGCTSEACSFRDEIQVFRKKGAVIVGVSIDSVESHKKFAGKYDLPFTLLSDGKKEMVKAYGVWKQKNMYGKKYMGVERTTFIIDEEGRIAQIFRKVKVDGHTNEVLVGL